MINKSNKNIDKSELLSIYGIIGLLGTYLALFFLYNQSPNNVNYIHKNRIKESLKQKKIKKQIEDTKSKFENIFKLNLNVEFSKLKLKEKINILNQIGILSKQSAYDKLKQKKLENKEIIIGKEKIILFFGYLYELNNYDIKNIKKGDFTVSNLNNIDLNNYIRLIYSQQAFEKFEIHPTKNDNKNSPFYGGVGAKIFYDLNKKTIVVLNNLGASIISSDKVREYNKDFIYTNNQVIKVDKEAYKEIYNKEYDGSRLTEEETQQVKKAYGIE